MSDWKATYVNANGDAVAFDDLGEGLQQTGDIVGLDMPPISFNTTQAFDLPGEIEDNTVIGAREITVPMAVLAPNGLMLREKVRSVVSRLSPTLGLGTLTLDRNDNGRQIGCKYRSGMEGSLELTDWGDMWQEHLLIFHAFDPFFTDSADTVLPFRVQGDTGVPFFPLFTGPNDMQLAHFGTSTVFGQADVRNSGDALAWPVITVNGPIASPVFINSSSGASLDLSANGGLILGGGESAVIDTRPGEKSITKDTGENLMRFVGDVSALWPLALGDNVINIQAGGATGETLINFAFRQRYLAL